MRTYEQTHPWLSFRLDLRAVSPRLWIALGEAQSKCEHIAGVPLRPATVKELHGLYLAKGALATTAIEGNTLTEEEVLQRLEGKLKLPPSREYLGQEVDNVVHGCDQIANQLIQGDPPELSVEKIREFNRIVLAKLPLNAGVIPGEIRTHSVGVADYRGAPAEDCEFLLDRLCRWLNGEEFRATEDVLIAYNLLKAIVAHLYLAWIHPFADGNGRTARLVEFQILLAAGVPTPAAHLLSNHYNQTRQEYYRQLQRSSRSGGEVLPFVEYAVQGFVDGLRSQLQLIRDQQWDITWRNYVHEMFRDKRRTSDARRRHLILDLSTTPDWVPVSAIREVSPRLAGAYAKMTQKAISRDLKILESMGLIERSPEGVRAKREMILAFLPARRRSATKTEP
jgi:Fic family protein